MKQSKSKHTPGPWHLIETASLKADGEKTQLLANSSPIIHGCLYGVAEADQALISAAPEMLEALETIQGVLDGHPEYRKLVKDIIAKAKGGAE